MNEGASSLAECPAAQARQLPKPIAASVSPARVLQDLAELTKLRVALLILFTTLAGFVLATKYLGTALDLVRLGWTLLGTGLVAGSAAALNQVLERDRDGRMLRTMDRPIPAGRMSSWTAALVAVLLLVAGISALALRTNPFAAAIAGLTWALYVFAYTPLKSRSHVSTVVGAVPGALPPLIGWMAAGCILQGPAWCLFGVIFFWQLPHFLAIAWLYREDYERGGYPMLTVLDPSGQAAARQSVLNTLALIVVSLIPAFTGQAGVAYAVVATLLGVAFLSSVLWLAAKRSRSAARATILASIVYLPLLLLAIVIATPAV